MDELAGQIKTIRRQLGLTQQELADRLGVSRALVSMYEAGKRRPGLDKLMTLSRLGEMTLDELCCLDLYQAEDPASK